MEPNNENIDNSSCNKRKYELDTVVMKSTENEDISPNKKVEDTRIKRRRIIPQLISKEVRSVRPAEKEYQSRQEDMIDRWEPTANVHYRGAMLQPNWRQAIFNGLPTPEPSSDSESDTSGNEQLPVQPAFTSLRDMRPEQDNRQRLRMEARRQQHSHALDHSSTILAVSSSSTSSSASTSTTIQQVPLPSLTIVSKAKKSTQQRG